MPIRVVTDRISRQELKVFTADGVPDIVKAMVDLDRGLFAVGGPMHRDIEVALLSSGSHLHGLWGFVLHLDRPWAEAFEFRSQVNIRPADGCSSIQIRDEKICRAIIDLAAKHIDWGR